MMLPCPRSFALEQRETMNKIYVLLDDDVGDVIRQVFYRFAPEGRDVYSLAFLSILRSSVGAQSLLSAPTKVSPPHFAPSGARSLVCARNYKHLAPLERKRIRRLYF